MNQRVRLLAVNYASNALGTINDVKKMTEISHMYGALVYVDAVQYVPHAPVDVRDLDCEFLVCSAYKFFGPHQGILYGKKYLLDKLKAYKVRPADDYPPGKFETGTQSHEGQAGTLGALEYLCWIGETMSGEYHARYEHLDDLGRYLHAAMTTIKEYEQLLSKRLMGNLQKIPGLKIHGITGEDEVQNRVPTVSFTIENRHPARIAKILGSENVFVWDGDFYALEVIKHLKLEQSGGMLRVGAVHYNTADEIDVLSGLLEEICSGC
jgi:selenocysteine lyase/cysteine desulfurase